MFRHCQQSSLLKHKVRLALILGLAGLTAWLFLSWRPVAALQAFATNHTMAKQQRLVAPRAISAPSPNAPAMACLTPPTGLVSWWPMDGNALDFNGVNDATTFGTFVPGKVAQALKFANGNVAKVNASPSFGAGNGLTIDLWINPDDVASQRPLVEWNDGFNFGAHLWISVACCGGGQGNIYANLRDTSFGTHLIQSAPNLIQAGVFQHVALTYDKTTGVSAIYLNGNVVAQQNLGVFTPQTGYDLWFGNRASTFDPSYVGLMDEIDIFNRALSASEIQAIYTADSAGKCKVGTIFTVTNTNDSGAGSLRQAITDSNASPDISTIRFNIQSGNLTIIPASLLPSITGPVTIDGTTQPGFAGTPLIELNGAGLQTNGLVCQAAVTIKGLVINRFGGHGIFLGSGSSGSVIVGNYIGTNVTGTAALGNSSGINVSGLSISDITIGGTTAGTRNIISGNRVHGIDIGIAYNVVVQGNFIGTDITGTLDLGNSSNGIFASNIFGNDSHMTIGGPGAAARNLISGNGGFGIYVRDHSHGSLIQGNYIGTDITGSVAIGNSSDGLKIESMNNQLLGNVISGNFGRGIDLNNAAQNVIQGNRIGTDASGSAGLGNNQGGLLLEGSSSFNTIGLDSNGLGTGNTIAFNANMGVIILGNSVANSMRGNSIFSNSFMGINLVGAADTGFGVTPNDTGDGDTGPNNLQNFPVLTSVLSSNGNLTVQGTLNSTAGTSFRIELFSNDACSVSGWGEGKVFLGFTNINTNASGNGNFSFTVPTASLNGVSFLTATATDANGNTSEFSQCFGVSGGIGINNLQFYPLAHPVRLLDTRPGQTGCDAPGAMISGGTSRTQTAAGRTCDGLTIPANARVLTGNITTVESGGGFLTLYPSDVARPLVANSNFAANQILNNVFTVGLGAASGAFNIFVTTNTNVVVDVTGYYAPPSASGLYFHPLPHPVRLLDTRVGATACFTPGAQLAAGSTTTQLGTTTCDGVLIPGGAQALAGNATTVNSQANGFLTLFPADATRPLAASSNFQTGITMNAPLTVGLSPSGQFNIYTSATTDLVVDVLGYFSAQLNDSNGQGLLFNPLPTPIRLLDTRAGQTGCFTPGSPMIGGGLYLQPVPGNCTGIPITAKAVVGNTTTVNVTANGFLTFWADGNNRPLIATSNYRSGAVFNRHFIVGVGLDGAFRRYASTTTDLVIDLSGYFAP